MMTSSPGSSVAIIALNRICLAPAETVISSCANSTPLSGPDGCLELWRAIERGIFGRPGIHRTFRRVLDVLRRIEIGLSRSEHDDVPALTLQLRRKSRDLQDLRGADRGKPARRPQYSRCRPLNWSVHALSSFQITSNLTPCASGSVRP